MWKSFQEILAKILREAADAMEKGNMIAVWAKCNAVL